MIKKSYLKSVGHQGGLKHADTNLDFAMSAEALRNMPLDQEPIKLPMEDEVRQAEMESRLRKMITEVLRPSIVKVTKLQTDQEVMSQKFQEMIDGHQQVLNAQKEAKENSEVIQVFQNKLNEFWSFNNSLEDKINGYQKTTVQRMEELEAACELNRSNALRLGRNLDRALQDQHEQERSMKTLQATLERRMQKDKEHSDREMKNMHALVGEVRDMHTKLQIEVWGPEDVSDITPPCLRKLDMQMRKQTGLLSDALDDINALQKLDGEVSEVKDRQEEAGKKIEDLKSTTTDLGERVEVFAQEAKADFKQASNLMAAFSANLVREARHSFKDELKHAQQMQQEVDEFVRKTNESLQSSDEFVKSLSRQLEAMVKEMRTDLEGFDSKRHKDRKAVEETLADINTKVGIAAETSEAMLRGLEHVSGVVSMTLQSERMSAALDLQEYVERKETPFVGVRETTMETRKLHQLRIDRGMRQPGLNLEALHRLTYEPQPVSYQGIAFERPQLLALREKLVHVAQEVLQQPPSAKRAPGAGADASDFLLSSHLQNASTPNQLNSLLPGQGSRSSTPARPGSRGQPGARGSPGLEGFPDHLPTKRDLQKSPDSDDSDEKVANTSKVMDASPYPPGRTAAGPTPVGSDVQLPTLAKQRPGTSDDIRGSSRGVRGPPLTAR